MVSPILRWHSLKTKITLTALVLLLVSLWTLSFFASQMLRGDMEKLLGEQQVSTVSLLANQVNSEIVARRKALESVASIAAPALLGGAASMQSFIEQREVLQILFNGGIVAHTADGTAIADFPLSSGRLGEHFVGYDFIVAALKEGKSIIGRPFISPNAKSPILGMAVPIRDSESKIIGALVGVIDLALPNFLDQITENSYGKTGGYLLVDPKHRLIVTATDKRRILEQYAPPGSNPAIDLMLNGFEGSSHLINPRGLETLTSAKSVSAAGWIAVASLPIAEAFAPINEMQQRMLLITLLLTLLAGGFGWWLLKRQL